MADMGIYDFLSKLKGGGARPNLFRVMLSFPLGVIETGTETESLSFLCKAASLPAATVGVIEVPFRGRQVKLPGDRTFEEWAITVINDTDFQIRNAFERWSSTINKHRENVGETVPQNLMSKATIEQLDRSGAVIKSYDMVGIWPSQVAAIEVSAESTDAIEEFAVNIQYQFWESNTTS